VSAQPIKGATCGHAELFVRDFANQPQKLYGSCLFCQRDELLGALTKACGALDHLALNIGREDGEAMTREGATSFAAAEWESASAVIAKVSPWKVSP
jgi:hypothetical protein